MRVLEKLLENKKIANAAHNMWAFRVGGRLFNIHFGRSWCYFGNLHALGATILSVTMNSPRQTSAMFNVLYLHRVISLNIRRGKPQGIGARDLEMRWRRWDARRGSNAASLGDSRCHKCHSYRDEVVRRHYAWSRQVIDDLEIRDIFTLSCGPFLIASHYFLCFCT